MPDIHTDDSIDTLLRTALADRPEPATEMDFAARVLTVARVAERPKPAAAWPLWLAVASVAAMFALAAWRLSEMGSWSSAESTLAATSTNSSTALLPVGGAAFLLTLVWVIARAALDDAGKPDTLTVV